MNLKGSSVIALSTSSWERLTNEIRKVIILTKGTLHIQLIGENKFICTNEEYAIGIYAGNYNLNKDLALIGDGSLTIEIPNAIGEAAGLSAANLTVATDQGECLRVSGLMEIGIGSTVTASAKNTYAIGGIHNRD